MEVRRRIQKYDLEGVIQRHNFSIPGLYEAKLTVKDGRGNYANCCFRINVSRKEVNPSIPLITIKVGPIRDESSRAPVEGASVILYLDGGFVMNSTGKDGLVGFTIFQPDVYKEVILKIFKTGYITLTQENLIDSRGELTYGLPLLVKENPEGNGDIGQDDDIEEEGNIPEEEGHGEDGSSMTALIIVGVLTLLVLTIISTALGYYVIRKRKDGNEVEYQ